MPFPDIRRGLFQIFGKYRLKPAFRRGLASEARASKTIAATSIWQHAVPSWLQRLPEEPDGLWDWFIAFDPATHNVDDLTDKRL